MTVKSWPLLIAAGASVITLGSLLIWAVAKLLRSNREQIVATLPLAREQKFEFSEPSSLLLMVEVPRIGSGFRDLAFEIGDESTGQLTRLSYDFVRARGAYKQSPFILEALSQPNGFTDRRHRPLCGRPLTQLDTRRLAIVRTTAWLSRPSTDRPELYLCPHLSSQAKAKAQSRDLTTSEAANKFVRRCRRYRLK